MRSQEYVWFAHFPWRACGCGAETGWSPNVLEGFCLSSCTQHWHLPLETPARRYLPQPGQPGNRCSTELWLLLGASRTGLPAGAPHQIRQWFCPPEVKLQWFFWGACSVEGLLLRCFFVWVLFYDADSWLVSNSVQPEASVVEIWIINVIWNIQIWGNSAYFSVGVKFLVYDKCHFAAFEPNNSPFPPSGGQDGPDEGKTSGFLFGGFFVLWPEEQTQLILTTALRGGGAQHPGHSCASKQFGGTRNPPKVRHCANPKLKSYKKQQTGKQINKCMLCLN